MSLGDALDSGLLVVEFDDSVDVGEPEIVQKTYAIHAVVNQRLKKKVAQSFLLIETKIVYSPCSTFDLQENTV